MQNVDNANQAISKLLWYLVASNVLNVVMTTMMLHPLDVKRLACVNLLQEFAQAVHYLPLKAAPHLNPRPPPLHFNLRQVFVNLIGWVEAGPIKLNQEYR